MPWLSLKLRTNVSNMGPNWSITVIDAQRLCRNGRSEPMDQPMTAQRSLAL